MAGVVLADVGGGFAVDHAAGFQQREAVFFGGIGVVGAHQDLVGAEATVDRLQQGGGGRVVFGADDDHLLGRGHVERFSFRKSPALLTPIHDELDVWASGAIPVLMDAEPDLPEELSDRAADVWEPLLAIADLAGGDWPDRARAAARILSAGEHGNRLSLGVMALRDIKFVFESKVTDALATADLVKGLLAMDESPWADMWGGKELDSRSLARILTAYDIKPKSVRLADGSIPRGYRKGWFVDAWSRYIQRDATTPTNTVPAPSNVADVALVGADTGSGSEEEQEWDLQH